MWETRVRSLGLEDPLEKEMATHSSILTWRIPWRGSLVGYSPQGGKESDMTEWFHFFFHFFTFLSPRDLPDPVIESRSPALQAESLPSEPPSLEEEV